MEDLEAPGFLTEHDSKGLLLNPGETLDFVPQHFGCRLSKTADQRENTLPYKLCSFAVPVIQVTADVNQNPSEASHQKLSCDPKAPPITLPTGSFVSFKPHKALFLKKAFWALPILSDATSCLSDKSVIWGLISQRLLWLLGDKVMIHSTRSESTEISFKKIETLLWEWQCESKNIIRCIKELVNVMVDKGHLDQRDN